ncbi:MAG: hydantoinase B/oxoprolinase family protein, partial [Chthoniobacteraceae bacterium]
EALAPGDVLITNDPWLGTGHLADVSVAKPIFLDGEMVGFAASVAHAPDMGGRTGSTESRDVFEEGFQIPVMKFCNAGVPDATFVKVLRKNVRAPDEVEGDLWAQVGALELMESRLVALMRHYKLRSLRELAAEIHDRSERAMRAAIRDVPDGSYEFEVTTDGLDEPMQIRIAITVRGEELDVDYTGTSLQVEKALNSAFCYTYAYTMYGLKCVLSPEIPNNEGAFRPIRITAPEGSILNHRFPASGCSRAMLGHYLPFAVFGALGRVVPERIIAGSGSPIWSVLMRGVDERGRQFANKLFYNGGTGASHRRDGMNATSWPSNISLTPAEVVEQLMPCRVVYKRLRPGSAGDGEYRGGLGQDILLESRSPAPVFMVFLAERTKYAAPGVAGGQAGDCGALVIDGKAADPKKQHILKPGGTVLLRTPGGGGYGISQKRSAAARESDRKRGYL